MSPKTVVKTRVISSRFILGEDAFRTKVKVDWGARLLQSQDHQRAESKELCFNSGEPQTKWIRVMVVHRRKNSTIDGSNLTRKFSS